MTQSQTATPLVIDADRPRLAEVCARHGIRWLAVFGSVARGEARVDSDVDLLVEFEPGTEISYIDLENIAVDLKRFFGGRHVDIAKPKQLHWMVRDRVLAEARVVYAR